jgi:hypothetical protein
VLDEPLVFLRPWLKPSRRSRLSWRDDWISNNIYFQSWALGVSGWIVALAFGDWWSARDHINYVAGAPRQMGCIRVTLA